MKAILAALFVKLGIVITRFIAFVISGSASMLAEGVHSLADSGNQLLLIIDSRRHRSNALPEQPFGYGLSSYEYAVIVSTVLSTVGGVFSIYTGLEKLSTPPLN